MSFELRRLNANMGNLLLASFTGLLVIITIGNRVFGDEFCAEGEMNYKVLSLTGETVVEQDHQFTVSVQDCKWHIKKVPRRFIRFGKEQPLEDYSIASTDLTNFYHLFSYETISKARNSSCGTIGPGTVPFGISDQTVIILWYTFGSGCYFSAVVDPYLNPPATFTREGTFASDFRVKASWQLAESLPFLPKAIQFDSVPRFQAGATSAVSSAGTTRQHFTNCQFKVQEWVSAGSLEIPKRVDVQYFDLNPTNSSEIIHCGNLRIAVTNVRSSISLEHFQVKIPGSALLADLRGITPRTPFAVQTGLTTNWPSVEFSRTKARLKALAEKRKSTRRLPLVQSLIMILALFPIAAIARRAWKAKNTTNRKERQI